MPNQHQAARKRRSEPLRSKSPSLGQGAHLERATVMDAFRGRLLRARRRQVDLTPPDLSRRTGRSYPTLIKLERDEARPSVDTLVRLANALDCSIADLIGPAEEP